MNENERRVKWIKLGQIDIFRFYGVIDYKDAIVR